MKGVGARGREEEFSVGCFAVDTADEQAVGGGEAASSAAGEKAAEELWTVDRYQEVPKC